MVVSLSGVVWSHFFCCGDRCMRRWVVSADRHAQRSMGREFYGVSFLGRGLKCETMHGLGWRHARRASLWCQFISVGQTECDHRWSAQFPLDKQNDQGPFFAIKDYLFTIRDLRFTIKDLLFTIKDFCLRSRTICYDQGHLLRPNDQRSFCQIYIAKY